MCIQGIWLFGSCIYKTGKLHVACARCKVWPAIMLLTSGIRHTVAWLVEGSVSLCRQVAWDKNLADGKGMWHATGGM